MSKRCLLLAAFLPVLSLLRPAASGHCQRSPRSICSKHDTFVPGHSFIGEGVDITTLKRKGAYVMDTSQWQGPNGTCTLCRNPLMGGQLQKLPLAAADWRARGGCHKQASSSVEYSDVDVANAVAKEVNNDWKIELQLGTEKNGLPMARVAFAGSRSRMTLYAHEKSQHDSYMFFRQEVSCEYYRLRLLQSSSLQSSHFSWAVDKLPGKPSPEEYQHFIDIYGTHYISHVQLGGRVRHLTALQTCVMVLNDLSASSIKECIKWEAGLGDAELSVSKSFSSMCEVLWRGKSSGKYHKGYTMQHTEVEGGDKQVEMLFLRSRTVQHLSKWMESAKVKPGLVSYSLLPLHTLLERTDPRRDLMKQAIVAHINQRALIRDCPQNCPRWSSEQHCTCMCQANSVTDQMCCARKEGMAHLRFHIHSGSDLWGDRFTATDALVKVFFNGQVRQTRVIYNDNGPQWLETLDFGTVELSGYNPFVLEVWDDDVWHDDLLHVCHGNLVAGADPVQLRCHLSYGYLDFSYLLVCGHTMGGPSCHDYVPLQLPKSYFNNTTPTSRATFLSW
ncbi:perforin-1-like [Elgaria multicarinata webbii]|uniref:perforin-1-like n=1 Tax=Elgaria multicarinata webbii TaxID=159646 RepID=UPI002FCCCC80